jgi:triosephosphate isomerase
LAEEVRQRRIVAVGLKAYLGKVQTQTWLDAVVESRAELSRDVDIVVLPVAPLLSAAVGAGRAAGFAVGAQQVSDRPAGAYTGELPASLLRELGVTYAEVGHAERRFLYGETPAMVRAKVTARASPGVLFHDRVRGGFRLTAPAAPQLTPVPQT